MEAELTCHLGYEKHDQGEKTLTNRRNGKTAKGLGSSKGLTINNLALKSNLRFGGVLNPSGTNKILSMYYALGLMTRQIQDFPIHPYPARLTAPQTRWLKGLQSM
jgi:transposase-like protein